MEEINTPLFLSEHTHNSMLCLCLIVCFGQETLQSTEGAFQQFSQVLRRGVCLHDGAERGRCVRSLGWMGEVGVWESA